MSAPLSVVRLPSPPKEYEFSYMARLINTLELEKQAAFFATSSASKTTEDVSQAEGWFLG
jgi:hypothetical protein|tara:strand:- start:1117 stop:1296 length:180 start_codon:yes stop_codon:yes gene_type:complete